MKTPTALSVTSSQREQTSLRSQVPRLPRSNVCSTRDLENPSASVHRKRFSTPSLTLKFLCAGKLNPRGNKHYLRSLQEGAARIDLNGKPAGEVDEEQAAHARSRLVWILEKEWEAKERKRKKGD